MCLVSGGEITVTACLSRYRFPPLTEVQCFRCPVQLLTVPGRKVNQSLPLRLGHERKPSSARLLDHRSLGFLHLLPSGEAHPGTRLCVCVTHAAQGKSKGCVSVSPVPSAGPWPGHGERGLGASRTYASSSSQPEAPFSPRAGGSPVPPRVQTGGFRPTTKSELSAAKRTGEFVSPASDGKNRARTRAQNRRCF